MTTKELTIAQEFILFAMWAEEKRQGRGVLVFTPGFFTMTLGVQWNSYYRTLMDNLADKGWIKKAMFRARWHYELTPAATICLDERSRYAATYAAKTMYAVDNPHLITLDDLAAEEMDIPF